MALELHCNYRFISTIYACDSAEVMLSGKPDELSFVNSDHFCNKTICGNHEKVEGLRLQTQQSLMFMPNNLYKFYPNLILIEVKENKLGTISRSDIGVFKNLKLLNLRKNLITHLPQDLFKDTPNIAVLDFGENLLTSVGFGILDPLVNVASVYFDHNPCIDQYFDSQSNVSMTHLKFELASTCIHDAVNVVMQIPIFSKMKEAAENFNDFPSYRDQVGNLTAKYNHLIAKVELLEELIRNRSARKNISTKYKG